MSKGLKTFNLDLEVIKELESVGNRKRSELVNSLLKRYFNDKKLESLSDEDLKREMRIAEIQVKADKEIEAIRNGS